MGKPDDVILERSLISESSKLVDSTAILNIFKIYKWIDRFDVFSYKKRFWETKCVLPLIVGKLLTLFKLLSQHFLASMEMLLGV